MEKIVITCSCCGLSFEMPEDCELLDCPACGTGNARPRSTGNTLEILKRATQQRLNCDFHNAELSYQQVLLFNPDEHEALWGRLLCHYGVEYVEDPATKRLMPTVHSVQKKPMQAQSDFVQACTFAPEAVRAQYEKDAAYIDEAQASIRQLAESCPPYDVFLCHKTTKPGMGEKTEDFHRATQLYHYLKDQGVQVFFAPECLQNIAGANYEAGIYHALNTARVMLVICSNEDYLTSAWVRSEWSRFLELMDEDQERRLVPLMYDHFSTSKLPAPIRFRKLQGMDMTDITASQKLMEMLEGCLELHKAPPAPQPAPDSKAASERDAFPIGSLQDLNLDSAKDALGWLVSKAGNGVQSLTEMAKDKLSQKPSEKKPSPEKKPKPEKAPKPAKKPAPQPVAPPPKPQPPKLLPPPDGFVYVIFPERLPAWQKKQSKKIKWYRYKLFKKGLKESLSEIKWGETVQIPAKDGDMLHVCLTNGKGKRRGFFGKLFTFLALSITIVGIPAAFLSLRPALKIPVTPCRHYELKWNLFKNKIGYKQY